MTYTSILVYGNHLSMSTYSLVNTITMSKVMIQFLTCVCVCVCVCVCTLYVYVHVYLLVVVLLENNDEQVRH